MSANNTGGNNAGQQAALHYEGLLLNKNENTKKMVEADAELKKLDEKIANLKEDRKNLQLILKPVRRIDKESSFVEINPLSKEERKKIRALLKIIKEEMRTLRDQRYEKYNEFTALCEVVGEEADRKELARRANSKEYLKQNAWSIRGRVINTLNAARKKNLVQLKALATLAKSRSKKADEQFNPRLSDLLDATDPETYVLCSGLMRPELYEAIRLTLKAWDSRRAAEFTELIMPE